MKFESPIWLHGLWLLPLLALLRLWAGREARIAAGALVATRLKEWLITSAAPARAWGIFGLQLLALAAFVLALAKPTWGDEKIERPEKGKNLMFVIDTSRSMLANDVLPNRLGKAKLAIEDIMATLSDYRLGVVAYAGRGYLQAPLTSDHEAVLETVQALDTGVIPRGGSIPSEGIKEALIAFEKTKAKNHGIILFSDGGDEDPDLERQLTEAKKAGVTILSIGVGTASGSLIPDPDARGTDQVIIDPATGQPVHTHLDDKLLRRAAEATGGIFLTLGTQSLTGGIIQDVMRSVQAMEAGQKELTRPIQQFYWPLGTGIVALMLALILRPLGRAPQFSTATAAVAIMLTFGAAAANGKESKEVQEAREAYDGQQFQRARDAFGRILSQDEPPADRNAVAYGLGASSHQLKDYDRALDGYSTALESPDPKLQRMSHRGLAGVLYDQGCKALGTKQPEFTLRSWEDALRHFDAALRIQDDSKTAANRRHVEEQIQQLKQQMEQQKQQQKQKQKGDKQEGKEGEKGEEGEGEGEPQDGQKGQDGQQQPGQQGKDGQPQDGKSGEQGQQQEQGQGGQEKKDELGQQGQEGEESKDGKDGKEGQQMQQGQGTPEGQIQANSQSGMTKEDIERIQQMVEEKIMEATGYSRNQARDLIRAYSDQMPTQFRRRKEQPNGKDW